MPRIVRTIIPLILVLGLCATSWAAWKFNPHTNRSDYYQNSEELVYDNETSGMTGDTVQEALDELAANIASITTTGLNLAGIDVATTTTGIDTKYILMENAGSAEKITAENILDWIAADGGFESHTSNDIDPDRLAGDTSDDNKIDAGIIADLSASYLALGADIVAATGNNAFTIDSDDDSSDTLILRAYDSNQTAYDSMVTLTSGNEPTITIAADGTIGISSGGNTTINGITAAAGGAGNVTLGGNLYLAGDPYASDGNNAFGFFADDEAGDAIYINVRDVDGSNWDSVITATSGNTPTVAIATDGNTTINGITAATGSGGTVTLGGALILTGDISVAAGNNAFTIDSDDDSTDTLVLRAYDSDQSAFDSMVTLTSGNTPTLTLAADGGITVSNATTLNGSMTVSNGCALDLSGVTMSASTDEGLALPVWADVTPATTAKRWLAWDESGGVMQVYTNGGWQEIGAGGSGGAPTTAGYLITGSLNATLTAERVLTAGEGIDFDDGGVNSTFTINCEDATDSNKGVAYFSSDNFLANSGGITIKDGGVAPAELASTDFGVFTVAAGVASLDADTVNATHIDWGTGANQIDLDDIPDSANYQKVAAADVDSNSHVNLVQDSDGTGAVQFTGITSGTSVKTFSNGNATVVEEGVATGGLLIGDSSPDTGGEIGYASNALSFHDGTASRTVMTIDSAQNVSADKEIQDNVALSFGNDNDWEITYDETTDDRLEFTHTAGAGADVYWDLNDNAADSTYTITNSDGTYEADLIVEGDITCSGAITSNASGDSYLALANNAALAASGNRLYFVGNELYVSENGDADVVLTQDDSATLTGTSWNFSAVTNFEIPNSAAPTTDDFGEIAADNNAWASGRGAIQVYDGTANTWLIGTISADTPHNGQVPKWNTGGTITWEDDLNGGSPSINSVTDATAAAEIDFEISETMTWNFVGDFTTGSQFLIEQKTGNPSGGTLFEVKAADANLVAASIGDGTNKINISNTGALTLGGTASIMAGGLVLGDASPDASGEIGYDSNAFKWYANSEDMMWTAGTNTWTYSSNTDAVLVLGSPTATQLTVGKLLGVNSIVSDGGTVILDGAVLPGSAGGADLGSATAEWDDLYLHDGAIIYGQADQSVTITSSAAGWTFNKGVGLLSSDDPDLTAAGQISHDTDGWLRVYDNSVQKALPLTEEIHITVIKPNDLADAQRDKFPVWSNDSGMTFVVTAIEAWSDVDSSVFAVYEYAPQDWSSAAATVEASVDTGTTGTSVANVTVTDIDNANIDNGNMIILDFDDTDNPGVVKITIRGYYLGDVN